MENEKKIGRGGGESLKQGGKGGLPPCCRASLKQNHFRTVSHHKCGKWCRHSKIARRHGVGASIAAKETCEKGAPWPQEDEAGFDSRGFFQYKRLTPADQLAEPSWPAGWRVFLEERHDDKYNKGIGLSVRRVNDVLAAIQYLAGYMTKSKQLAEFMVRDPDTNAWSEFLRLVQTSSPWASMRIFGRSPTQSIPFVRLQVHLPGENWLVVDRANETPQDLARWEQRASFFEKWLRRGSKLRTLGYAAWYVETQQVGRKRADAAEASRDPPLVRVRIPPVGTETFYLYLLTQHNPSLAWGRRAYESLKGGCETYQEAARAEELWHTGSVLREHLAKLAVSYPGPRMRHAVAVLLSQGTAVYSDLRRPSLPALHPGQGQAEPEAVLPSEIEPPFAKGGSPFDADDREKIWEGLVGDFTQWDLPGVDRPDPPFGTKMQERSASRSLSDVEKEACLLHYLERYFMRRFGERNAAYGVPSPELHVADPYYDDLSCAQAATREATARAEMAAIKNIRAEGVLQLVLAMVTEHRQNQRARASSKERWPLFGANVLVLLAPPGTAKTHTGNATVCAVRARGGKPLACAQTGKARKHMCLGKTFNSTFSLSLLDFIDEAEQCRATPNYVKRQRLRQCDYIWLDEISQMSRKALQAASDCMNDLMGVPDKLRASVFFGGIPVLCSGDYRQILVILGARRTSQTEVYEACSLHFLQRLREARCTTFVRPVRCPDEEFFAFALQFGSGGLNDASERVAVADFPKAVGRQEFTSRSQWQDCVPDLVRSLWPKYAEFAQRVLAEPDRISAGTMRAARELAKSVYLAPLRSTLRIVGEHLLTYLPGTAREFLSSTEERVTAERLEVAAKPEQVSTSSGGGLLADGAHPYADMAEEDQEALLTGKNVVWEKRTSDWLRRRHIPGSLPGLLRLKRGTIVSVIGAHIDDQTLKGDCGVVAGFSDGAILVHFMDDIPPTGEEMPAPTIITPRTVSTKTSARAGSDVVRTVTRTNFPLDSGLVDSLDSAQGRTAERVFLDLIERVFAHGHLAVGLTRCRRADGLRLLLRENQKRISNPINRKIFPREGTSALDALMRRALNAAELRQTAQAIFARCGRSEGVTAAGFGGDRCGSN